jgi:hypothetical protein
MIKPFIYKGVYCIMKENDNDNRFINNVNIDYELLHYSSTLFYIHVTEVLDYEEETLAYYAKGYRKRKYIDP